MFHSNNALICARRFVCLTLATILLPGVAARPNHTSIVRAATSITKAKAAMSSQTQALAANGKIAFASNRDGNFEIYVMNPDGSNQTRLTNNPARDNEPTWSPDGAKIAFVTDRDANAEIYVMNADGSSQTRLSNNPEHDSDPDWSPDGTKLVFVRQEVTSSGLFVMNADGSEQREIIEGFFSSPVWAPDGTKFAFVCAGADDFSEDICVINANGSDLRRLTEAQFFGSDHSPAWSPDGAKILFVQSFLCIFEPCTDTLSVVNPDGSNQQQLLSLARIGNPGWSPDGTRITFDNAQPSSSTSDIFVADSNGRGLVKLSNHAGRDSDPDWQPLLTTQPPGIQFSTANFLAAENSGNATIIVTRTGDIAAPVSVDFTTVDDPAAVRCDTVNGTAYARCDYATTLDTLTFAPGEALRAITLPLIDDAHVEGNETVQLALRNPTGAPLGTQSTATLTITDNDTAAASNPIFTTPFFVRQQYLDFLAREPEAGEPWSGVLNSCADVNNLDPNSASAGCDRINVSANFFGSPEFRLKGYFAYLFYKVALGRRPVYAEIVSDMRAVTGATAPEVFQKKAAFTDAFASRLEFNNLYAVLSHAAYVDALFNRYDLQSIATPDPANPDGTTLTTLTRADLVNQLNTQTLTRAQVLRAVVQSREVDAVEFNGAFVAMQYFGYLRRTPDDGGYIAWLNYLTAHPTDFRTMVNGFMNSTEYRLRFGQP